MGTFSGELTLDEGAPPGYYGIREGRGGYGFEARFEVASYRPPEFEVEVIPVAAELSALQGTEVTVEARYFHGAALPGAQAEWHITSEVFAFAPAQHARYTFSDSNDPWACRWCWWRYRSDREIVLSGTGTTDAQGTFSINVPAAVMTGGQRLSIEATVEGQDGGPIAGRGELVVHQSQLHVGLAPLRYINRAGSDISVDVLTIDWDGNRVPDQTLAVEISRREWTNTFAQGVIGGTWEGEPTDVPVFTTTITTDALAQATVAFVPDAGGAYRISVSGLDGDFRTTRSSAWVWVSGSAFARWRRTATTASL